jgi:hypothetical protein
LKTVGFVPKGTSCMRKHVAAACRCAWPVGC